MTNSSFFIREALQEDRGDLFNLFRDHFRWNDDDIQAHLDSCMNPETCVHVFNGQDRSGDFLKDDDRASRQGRLFVAVIDGVVAGFGHAALQPNNAGYICDLHTDSAYRKRGVCTGLIKACENWFSEQGMKASSMSVYKENKTARDLYEHRGYADNFNNAVSGLRLTSARIPAPEHLLMVKCLG